VRATREHEAPLAVAAAAIIEAAAAHERVRADDVAIVGSHGVAP
jgi:hypothetical protein